MDACAFKPANYRVMRKSHSLGTLIEICGKDFLHNPCERFSTGASKAISGSARGKRLLNQCLALGSR